MGMFSKLKEQFIDHEEYEAAGIPCLRGKHE